MLAVLSLAIVVGASSSSMPARPRFPQVLAHRGASGYVPEHSLNAYQLAIDLGTDYVEPDLCVSKDGVLVAMHDLLLDDTTDVASRAEFADRKTTRYVDGVNTTGFFVIDFTFQELRTLRLKQRMAGRTTLYDGLLQIPQFDEIAGLVQASYAKTNITVGLYIELKHPRFHLEQGFDSADMLLSALSRAGYQTGTGPEVPRDLGMVVPVVIQCFENQTLQYLRSKTAIPLIYLLTLSSAEAVWTSEGLSAVAGFADGVGPDKALFQTKEGSDGSGGAAADKAALARSVGLRVHPWTFRADSGIGSQFSGDFTAEQEYYLCCLKMDGLFTEFPDKTREVIDNFLAHETSSTCSVKC